MSHMYYTITLMVGTFWITIGGGCTAPGGGGEGSLSGYQEG